MPYIEEAVRMDYRVQAFSDKGMTAASNDQQDIFADIIVNWQYEESKLLEIYSRFGYEAEKRVIDPAIQESMKEMTAKYKAPALLQQRGEVVVQLELALKAKLAQYNIIVMSVSITNFDFSPVYKAAIEATAQQQQEVQKAEAELRQIQIDTQQKVVQAGAEKNAAIARAEGEARSTIIRAQANANATKVEAEAKAFQIKLINDVINNSPRYLKYVWIQQWDGKLPQVIFGDENISLILRGLSGLLP